MNIYEIYKPFRNHLRKISLSDSFYVIWSYVQNLQFKKEFPPDIEVILEYRNKNYRQKECCCSEWNLEILTREVILNSENSRQKSFKKWNYFSRAINKMKKVESTILKETITSKNVMLDVSLRMSHLQFEWQKKDLKQILFRYYKIFSEESLERILKKKTRLTARELYFINLMFTGLFLKSPAIKLPIQNIKLKGINIINIEKFLKLFSLNIDEVKFKMQEQQDTQNLFNFPSAVLRNFPIIEMNYRGSECLVCPIPTLLFWRATRGVYYEILKEKGFDHAFGRAFEKYIGKVLKKIDFKKIKFLPEITYKNKQNKSSDWILHDDKAILFVECKTKRLPISVKTSLDENILNMELEKMAVNIIKVYKAIKNFKEEKYGQFISQNNKNIYPLIVTLEQWYFFGEIPIRLLEIVKNKMKKSSIPLNYLKEMPYSICGVNEFENIIQIMNQVGINFFMKKKVFDKEKYQWMFEVFIESDFSEQIKNIKFLFNDEFKKFELESLRKEDRI